jgi:Family of unknown function (DUF6510)
MTGDAHLDGNALGGLFHDLFGREMTNQRACCGACGAIGAIGSLVAYRSAPGDVLRCSNCESVLMVAVALPSGLRVTMQSLRWVELADQ